MTEAAPAHGTLASGAGAQLPVKEFGAGASIVFIHGYPLDHRMWGGSVGSRFPRHRVILIDLPGFGDAATMESPSTLNGFAAAVARTLIARKVGPAVIVGHSMGGYIALEMYREHPELFSGLVLTNTRANPDSPEARDARLANAARLARPGEKLALDGTVAGLLAPATSSSKPGVVSLVRQIVGDSRPERLSPTLQALAHRPDLNPVLPQIRVPTLVLWGNDDGLIPPAQTQELIPRIRGATGEGFPGAGHLPCLEAPELFYGAVERFLPKSP